MRARRQVRLASEVARAVVTLAVIEVGVRVTDLPTICRLLRITLDVTSAAPAGPATAVLPENTHAAVRAANAVVARWPGGDSCLRRCLLLGNRLRGLRPVLRIGVRRDAGTFTAHAWLEIDGAALDPAASKYAALGAAGR